MNTVRRALGFSAIATYYAFGIQFVSIMLVSRWLTPEEIGTYSVAAVALFLASFLRNLGTSVYIIQAPELSPADMQRALGVVILMSLGVTGALIAGADHYANYFGVPKLADALVLIGLCYLFTPLVTPPVAVNMRRMNFGQAQLVRVASATAQAVGTGYCAYIGLGFMSMAYGLALGMTVEVAVAVYVRPADLPWTPRFRGMRPVFRFGGISSLAGVAHQLAQGVPDLVLGKLATMSDVGIFSRAVGVVMIFDRLLTQAVGPVVLPHFSKENREGSSMRDAYIRAVSLQTGFAWPFFAAFGAALLPVVRLLYGDQWDASVPIAEALIFWAALVATFSYGGPALLSVGRLNLNLAQASIALAARFGAVLYAVQYGLQSIAVAFIAVGILELVITTWFLYIAIGMTPLDLVRACTRSALVACLPLAACHGLAPAIYANISLEFFQVVMFGTLGMSCWLLGLYVFKHPLRLELHRVWDTGNELLTSIRSR